MPPLALRSLAFAAVAFAVAGGVFLAGANAQSPGTAEPRIVTNGSRAGDANAAVLQAIRTMPQGGTYSASRAAFDGLGRAIGAGPGGLLLQPEVATPSFCSSATYLVFVGALERLAQQGDLAWDAGTLQALLVRPGQGDGQGIWGRWNANGPGTARLFTELRLGRNFTEWSEARPGDFMKAFWTAEIGSKERGHSVVYLGTKTVGGQEYVRFWSSNTPSNPGDLSGYGEKLIPRTKVIRVIFSRLETPGNISRARELAKTDTFLASLLSRRVEMEEVKRMCGL